MADSEGTWQIGTDTAAEIAVTAFGQWSPTHANPALDVWATADAALHPVAQRALKRAVTQLAEIADGTRSILALDVTGTVSCESTTLAESATVPGGTPDANTGVVWLRNDGVLMFTDDAGTDAELSGAGAVPTLANVLAEGNATGAANIEIDDGQAIVGEGGGSIGFSVGGDIELSPDAKVVVDGNLELASGAELVGEDGGSIEFDSAGRILASTMTVGDPGTEIAGITIDGATWDAPLKSSALGGGATAASLILHAHSTTTFPLLITGRSNSNDGTHAIVTDGQLLAGQFVTGWDGTDYAIGGWMLWSVNGTPGSNDMPTKWEVGLSPDGSQSPTTRISILADGTTEINGALDVVTSVRAPNLEPLINLDYTPYGSASLDEGLSGFGYNGFANSSTQTAVWKKSMPLNYRGGDVTVRMIWTGGTGNTDNVRWAIQAFRLIAGRDISDFGDTPIETVFLAAGPASAMVSKETTVVLDNTALDGVQPGEQFVFAVVRYGAHVDDGYPTLAQLYGVQLFQ